VGKNNKSLGKVNKALGKNNKSLGKVDKAVGKNNKSLGKVDEIMNIFILFYCIKIGRNVYK
jgi:hypothetical protein